MKDPRSLVPESIMPGYPFLAEREVDLSDAEDRLKALSIAGVPYTQEMIENAAADLRAQADPNAGGVDALQERYPKSQARDFDGDPDRITEMDALVAYLQMLGTLVDFTTYDEAGPNLR